MLLKSISVETHAVKQVPVVAELLPAMHSMFGNWTMENSENVSKMQADYTLNTASH